MTLLYALGALVIVWVAYHMMIGLRDTDTRDGSDDDMAMPRELLARYATRAASGGQNGASAPRPKRGLDIFSAGGPKSWDEYIGQDRAKVQLKMAIASAKFRKTRLDHVLIASGAPGIGKTALSRLVAFYAGSGATEVQGEISQDEARAIFANMRNGDVLIWDEFHQAVNSGKRHAEWLLPMLQDGVLMSSEGEIKIPSVTVVAATTDAGLLPETILSRFSLKPVLDQYSADESADIAEGMAADIFESVGLNPLPRKNLLQVAEVGNRTPRVMGSILRQMRDTEIAEVATRDSEGVLDIGPTLHFSGLTYDGLDNLAQNYLLVLWSVFGGQSGITNIMGVLNEPEIPRLTEKLLMGKGYLAISRDGRKLTEAGKERGLSLAQESGLIDDEAVV